MKDGIGISTQELNRFKKQVDSFNAKKTLKLQQVTELAVRNIVAEAQRNVPGYQGRLRSSLRPVMAPNKLSGKAWTNVFYAPYVEFGTKSKVQIPSELANMASQFKGSGGGTFDEFMEQITKWVKKKGMPESAAYPVAMKILKYGIKAQPYLYPAFKGEIPKYINAIKRIMNEQS
jgi:hypothetical protein